LLAGAVAEVDGLVYIIKVIYQEKSKEIVI
jgi:hypothetical protein